MIFFYKYVISSESPNTFETVMAQAVLFQALLTLTGYMEDAFTSTK